MNMEMDIEAIETVERPMHRTPLTGLRILIVEDEVIIAMEIESNLQDAGAEILGPAHTVADGLALAANDVISAAVLDLRIGRDSVAPIARILTARDIPFLFYSGQSASDPVRAE
jgi:DNA-binding NarL/FixJ family response regulator